MHRLLTTLKRGFKEKIGWKRLGIAASLLITLLTFGSALLQDWSTAGTQLTYALVYFTLIFLHRHNGYSIDSWISRR